MEMFWYTIKGTPDGLHSVMTTLRYTRLEGVTNFPHVSNSYHPAI